MKTKFRFIFTISIISLFVAVALRWQIDRSYEKKKIESLEQICRVVTTQIQSGGVRSVFEYLDSMTVAVYGKTQISPEIKVGELTFSNLNNYKEMSLLYQHDIHGMKDAYIKFYEPKSKYFSRDRIKSIFLIALVISTILGILFYLFRSFQESFFLTLNNSIEQKIYQKTPIHSGKNSIIIELMTSRFKILNEVQGKIDFLEKSVRDKEKIISDQSQMLAIQEIAQQVSHDIRSPLSALNMMLNDLKELPEQKRVIVRKALERINDISNSLLEKSKVPPAGSIPAQSAPSPVAIPPAGAREVVLLSSMVGELLSEKRIQFREKMGVSIEEDLTKSYGYFASVNATELKRVFSNLINNSIEAFPEGVGRVTVGIRGYKDVVQIIVSDNGKGIPASVLAKLGERGVSHGKESSGTSGSGLGVYHAKSTVEAYGGKFEIQSREGHGTMIQIQLPRSVAPDWFVEELRLKPDMSIFSVDDDSSIHGIWSERLGVIGADKQGVSLRSYTSAKAFVDICEGLASEARANALFLVDYEFLNQGVNGLQVIEKLGIAQQAILVTSRYDEEDIQKKCKGMGVKLIPKALAGYVPIVVS